MRRAQGARRPGYGTATCRYLSHALGLNRCVFCNSCRLAIRTLAVGKTTITATACLTSNRPRSGCGISAAFCNHGRRRMPRSNIRWPTGHSEGAATGGALGSRWGRNPPRQFIGEAFALSHRGRGVLWRGKTAALGFKRPQKRVLETPSAQRVNPWAARGKPFCVRGLTPWGRSG